MTTITLWLLVAVSLGANRTPIVIEKLATEVECRSAKAAYVRLRTFAEPDLACVSAKFEVKA